MSEIADILDRAADLIEPEGAWTQGEFARNARGENTGLSEFRGPAVCWCALGAIGAVAKDDALDEAASDFLMRSLSVDVDEWNDAPERTQAEVVAKLREAAAKARAQS